MSMFSETSTADGYPGNRLVEVMERTGLMSLPQHIRKKSQSYVVLENMLRSGLSPEIPVCEASPCSEEEWSGPSLRRARGDGQKRMCENQASTFSCGKDRWEQSKIGRSLKSAIYEFRFIFCLTPLRSTWRYNRISQNAIVMHDHYAAGQHQLPDCSMTPLQFVNLWDRAADADAGFI